MAPKRANPSVSVSPESPGSTTRQAWTIDGELRLTNQTPGDAAARKEHKGLASHFVLKEGARSGAPEPLRPVNALGWSMTAGGLVGELHHHREAHLFYMVRGELTCEASGAWWLVPPQSALWVPGGVEHRIRARAPLEGYNVFIDPIVTRDRQVPAECCAVSMTPLLREIVLRLATRPTLYDVEGPDARLVSVLLDELTTLSAAKHRLPMPSDPRLQKLVTLMVNSPSDGADVKTWGKRIGLAERTLNRLLVQETGLSFGRWKQQLHIVLAIQKLARGASVQSVASDLGYESASGFVTMFRKTMGSSPRRYVSTRARERHSS